MTKHRLAKLNKKNLKIVSKNVDSTKLSKTKSIWKYIAEFQIGTILPKKHVHGS